VNYGSHKFYDFIPFYIPPFIKKYVCDMLLSNKNTHMHTKLKFRSKCFQIKLRKWLSNKTTDMFFWFFWQCSKTSYKIFAFKYKYGYAFVQRFICFQIKIRICGQNAYAYLYLKDSVVCICVFLFEIFVNLGWVGSKFSLIFTNFH
jgi:hypothetical protein